jgi:hypothetical protein
MTFNVMLFCSHAAAGAGACDAWPTLEHQAPSVPLGTHSAYTFEHVPRCTAAQRTRELGLAAREVQSLLGETP